MIKWMKLKWFYFESSRNKVLAEGKVLIFLGGKQV